MRSGAKGGVNGHRVFFRDRAGDAFLAVIFDCDGVLVDSEVLALKVELDALAELGVIYDPEEFRQRFMGMPDSAFFPALSADFVARGRGPLPDHFPQLHADRYGALVREQLTEVAGAALAVSGCAVLKAVASSSKADMLRFKIGEGGTVGGLRTSRLLGGVGAARQTCTGSLPVYG